MLPDHIFHESSYILAVMFRKKPFPRPVLHFKIFSSPGRNPIVVHESPWASRLLFPTTTPLYSYDHFMRIGEDILDVPSSPGIRSSNHLEIPTFLQQMRVMLHSLADGV